VSGRIEIKTVLRDMPFLGGRPSAESSQSSRGVLGSQSSTTRILGCFTATYPANTYSTTNTEISEWISLGLTCAKGAVSASWDKYAQNYGFSMKRAFTAAFGGLARTPDCVDSWILGEVSGLGPNGCSELRSSIRDSFQVPELSLDLPKRLACVGNQINGHAVLTILKVPRLSGCEPNRAL